MATTIPTMEMACRLCGKLLEAIRVNIFEPDSDHVKKIHKVLPITVNEYDPFPKTMCHRCSFKVNDFYEFRLSALRAEEFFKSQIPWLKDKQGPAAISNVDRPPMVRLPVSAFDKISPYERETEDVVPPRLDGLGDVSSPICIDDDSPPPSYEGDSETSYTILNNRSGDNVLRLQKKTKKKPKKRSIWNTKQRRRKKKSQMNVRITEVFTATAESQYSPFGNGYAEPDKDPFGISPESDDSNAFEEEKTDAPATENKAEEDKDKLPKYILVTQIPAVGAVYTCERCGRTLLTRDAAIGHSCAQHSNSQSQSQSDPDDRSKVVVAVERNASSTYSCGSCNLSFARRSQLETHLRSHYMIESSSDEQFAAPPVKRRRKTKKNKRSIPSSPPLNANNNEEQMPQSQLMRHLILSSDSD